MRMPLHCVLRHDSILEQAVNYRTLLAVLDCGTLPLYHIMLGRTSRGAAQRLQARYASSKKKATLEELHPTDLSAS